MKILVDELVKVYYIGYDSRFSEWQTKSDVIDMNDENTLEENEFRDNPWNNTEEEGLIFTGPLGAVSTVSKPFSLYEEENVYYFLVRKEIW